jgi:hypothetical protein
MKGFIETSDSQDKLFTINVKDIAVIEDLDKYTRLIKLSIVDDNGKPVIIKSIHSYQELQNKIKQALEE